MSYTAFLRYHGKLLFCVICGKEFLPRLPAKQITCSRQCRLVRDKRLEQYNRRLAWRKRKEGGNKK